MAKGERWAVFKAWMAQGAKDLHNQVVPAFPAYAHGVDEPGTPQNNRPSFKEMVAEQKQAATPAVAAEPELGAGVEP